MKVRGTCQRCGREVLVQQVVDFGGHCPWCGRPFQAQYTAVLVESLREVEDAGNVLEDALERIAGMDPALVLDEESVLGRLRQHLLDLRRAVRPRYP